MKRKRLKYSMKEKRAEEKKGGIGWERGKEIVLVPHDIRTIPSFNI